MTNPIEASSLPQRVSELSERTDELRQAVDRLDLRTARAEKVSFRTAGLLAVALVALVALMFVYAEVRTTARTVEQLQQANLCKFYALILGGYNPQTRTEGPDREAYEQAFRDMRYLREQLNCHDPLVPPRIGG